MSLEVSVDRRPTATVVGIEGELDVYTAGQLETALSSVVGQHGGDLVLDLADTTFLDSTALGVLVGVNKSLAGSGRAFKLVCPDPRLLKIFRITHLDSVWPIFSSVDDAVR